MKKICIVAPALLGPITNGGIGAHCYYHAITLAKDEDFDVTVLLTSKEARGETSYWREFFKAKNITYEVLDQETKYIDEHMLNKSYGVFLFLKDKHFDEIHFQDWYANGFVSIQAKKSGLHFQNTYFTMSALSSGEWVREGMKIFRKDNNDFLRDYCERFSTQYVNALITPTQHMNEWLLEHNWIMPQQVIKTPYICSEYQESSGQISLNVDYSHFCFYGRLETRKGLELFIQALKKLLNSTSKNYKISFLGKNATVQNGVDALEYIHENIDEYIQSNRIEVAIHTNFSADEATQYLVDTGAIAVMPSLMDNLPYVILDCIQNRNAFITSNIGGIAEVVDPITLFEATSDDLYKKMSQITNIDFSNLKHSYTNEVAEKNWIEISKQEQIASKKAATINENISYHFINEAFIDTLEDNILYSLDTLVDAPHAYIALCDRYFLDEEVNRKLFEQLSTENSAYSFYVQTPQEQVIPSLGYVPIYSEMQNSFAYGVLLLGKDLLSEITVTKADIKNENVLHIIATKLAQKSIEITSVAQTITVSSQPKNVIEDFDVLHPLFKGISKDIHTDFSMQKLLIPRYMETRECKNAANKRLKKLVKTLEEHKRYAVYGFNNFGKTIFKELLYREFDVRFFIDLKANELHDEEKGAFNVYTPQSALYENIDIFIIASDHHQNSMVQTLKTMGVDEKQIKCY